MDGWWNYVVRIAGTTEQNVIAKDSGIGTTVISRWFKGHNEPSARLVVTFARAHRRPPVEALVAAGYLTESDAAEVIEVHRGVTKFDDEELIAEVRRRMEEGRTNDVDPTQTAGTSGKAGKVKEAWSRSDELKERPGEVINSIKSAEESAVDGSHDGEDGHNLRRGEV